MPLTFLYKLIKLGGFALFFCWTNLQAQVEKAHELFNQKKYAAAAQAYEQALAEKNNALAASRLAYCYRMLNQTENAEKLYAEVVQNPKSRNDTYLFYAEALMSNGKYEEAKTWFLKYFEREPSDSSALVRADACDRVPYILPYFRGLKIEPFLHNSDADDNAPAFWSGGLVFTSDRPSGAALLKEKADWTGRDYLKLWWSKFDPHTKTFEPPQPFSSKLNELNKNIANASFSKDWETVYFSRNNNTPNKKGDYTLQLFTAERANNRWRNEKKLEFCLPELNYMHPAISSDGKRIFFASNAGTRGGFDIFYAEKNKNGEWRNVRNLGSSINTPAHEAFPYMHHDGRLFFASKGHAGYGGFDIFVTRWDSSRNDWQQPVNLGKPINSSLDDFGLLLANNDSVGVFTSGRDGGDDDLYLFWLGEVRDLEGVFYPKNGKIQESNNSTSNDSLPSESLPKNLTIKYLSDLDTALLTGNLKMGASFLLKNVQFDSTATELNPVAEFDLIFLDSLLRRHPNLTLELHVHTHTQGDEKALQKLAKARGTAIFQFFEKWKTPSRQLKIKGLGGKLPLFPCPKEVPCPPEIDIQNQRVEVVVLRV